MGSTMTYMREPFKKWIAELRMNNGKLYSKETISSYVTSLRTYASKLTDIKIDSPDLFNIDSIESFIPVYEKIKASTEFERVNKEYHRIFSSALIMYEKFLTEKSINQYIQPSFSEWLRAYPNHRYTTATITRYIRALEKCDEWLQIKLSKRIIEVRNLKEFESIEEKIKSVPNYSDVNQSHGNGEMSAALRLYRLYLEDISNNTTSRDDEFKSFQLKDSAMKELDLNVTIKELISCIKMNIEYKGFKYSDSVIENFYLSLKSKPFVILAGTSGTGKTKLVKLFAEAIGAHYEMVPVRPDWSDSSDLFGYIDLNGNYVAGEVLEFIAEAQEEPNRPY